MLILFVLAGLLFGPRIGWKLAGESGTLGHILGAVLGSFAGFVAGVLGACGFALLTEALAKLPWNRNPRPAPPKPKTKGRDIPEWVAIPIMTGLTAAIAAWIVWTDPTPIPPPLSKPLFVAGCAGVVLVSSCGTWLCRRFWST